MTKEETDKKFDAIIEFADIGDFLDVPVKHYSSGMFVRLGFAVAVHCEPDILLVDEVLAVGDLQFAHKCHKRMSKFRQSGGTVVIVSHNMQAIKNICKRVLWLNKGKIKEIGEVHKVSDLYEADIIMNENNEHNRMGTHLNYDKSIKIIKVEFWIITIGYVQIMKLVIILNYVYISLAEELLKIQYLLYLYIIQKEYRLVRIIQILMIIKFLQFLAMDILIFALRN